MTKDELKKELDQMLGSERLKLGYTILVKVKVFHGWRITSFYFILDKDANVFVLDNITEGTDDSISDDTDKLKGEELPIEDLLEFVNADNIKAYAYYHLPGDQYL